MVQSLVVSPSPIVEGFFLWRRKNFFVFFFQVTEVTKWINSKRLIWRCHCTSHLIGGVVSKLVFRPSMTLWGRLVMNAAAAWPPPTIIKLTSAAPSVDTQPAAPSPWRNITISSIQNVRFIPYQSEDIQYLIIFAAKPFNLGKPTIMKDLMYCVCGFTAHSGNKMAGHLGEKRWEIYTWFH